MFLPVKLDLKYFLSGNTFIFSKSIIDVAVSYGKPAFSRQRSYFFLSNFSFVQHKSGTFAIMLNFLFFEIFSFFKVSVKFDKLCGWKLIESSIL